MFQFPTLKGKELFFARALMGYACIKQNSVKDMVSFFHALQDAFTFIDIPTEHDSELINTTCLLALVVELSRVPFESPQMALEEVIETTKFQTILEDVLKEFLLVLALAHKNGQLTEKDDKLYCGKMQLPNEPWFREYLETVSGSLQ